MPISSYLGTAPDLAERIYVHESAQVIGHVRLGTDSSVWCNAVLRGDVNDIVIGRGSNIQDFTMVHVSHRTSQKPAGSPLLIGDYVTVGHSVILHGCRIGNECLVGMGSIVMDDVVVPDHVMIGAGSLIPPGKVLESGFLYLGRPVKKLRRLTGAEIAHLRYSAEHYVRVKDNYLNAPDHAQSTPLAG
jgi:carbonic anhydrase/acetyltransferase-like protein (isoleucine patch superfamily)